MARRDGFGRPICGRSFRWKARAGLLAAMAAAGGARAQSVDDPPIIDVIGTRAETVASEHAGLGEVIRPTDATRFDTKAQLLQNSALAVPETGRVSAAGFAVPRIRGQDTRLTEIYIEDTLLQDPFSGLPLVDELDLRAFGELALYQGVTPPALATVSPIGAVRYQMVPYKRPAFHVGATGGQPYGAAAWILGEEGVRAKDERFSARLYARRHRTNGRYRYYDDNATPYNAADDRYRIRENNDRASEVVMPSARFDDGVNTLAALSLWQDARAGLPSSASPLPSHARAHLSANVASIEYSRRFKYDAGAPPVLPDTAAVSLGTSEDLNVTRDPEQIVLDRDAQTLKVAARRGGVRIAWERSEVRLYARGDLTHAYAAANGQAFARTAEAFYAGLALAPVPALVVEAKVGSRAHDDAKTGATATEAVADAAAGSYKTRRLVARGGSLAVGYSLDGGPDGGVWRPYAQWGRAARLPSLLEELGDGIGVRAAPGVREETGRHLEAGVSALFRGLARAGLAAFEDETVDRITLLPAVGQTLRAQNLGLTRVRGVTLNGELFIGATHPGASVTAMEPLDLTSAVRPRQLAGVPDRQATLSLAQGLGPVVVRWASHGRSRIYRDARNEIETPAYWLHDLSADAALFIAGHPLKGGLAILNVADATHGPIDAAGGGTAATPHGESGLADVAGYPLPGRQWRLSVDCSL